jgi:hypothetical protein
MIDRAHGKEEKSIRSFDAKNLEESIQLEDQGIDGRKLLRHMVGGCALDSLDIAITPTGK